MIQGEALHVPPQCSGVDKGPILEISKYPLLGLEKTQCHRQHAYGSSTKGKLWGQLKCCLSQRKNFLQGFQSDCAEMGNFPGLHVADKVSLACCPSGSASYATELLRTAQPGPVASPVCAQPRRAHSQRRIDDSTNGQVPQRARSKPQ